MQGVLYAAIGVVFILGLFFVDSYRRRGRMERADAGDREAMLEETAAYAESARRVAEAEASSIRQLAQHEIDAQRRAAHAEIEALRRAAESDAASAAASAQGIRNKAVADADEGIAQARRCAEAEVGRLTSELREAEHAMAAQSRLLEETQQRLDAQAARLEAEEADFDRAVRELGERERELTALEVRLSARESELDQHHAEHIREMERVAGLTAEQAKAELLTAVEAVQRVASEQTTETVVSVLHLPGDEMKGRIIGREGRNIRAFEAVTGVNVIIDDTPEAVLLSCFDPVRREVGRLTLEKLILDGRIHPHRIEEVYDASKAEVDELCLRAARDALAEVGISDLDERLLPKLGRLRYRTSYGQNVLGHLLETAHIAGVMAAELGLEPTLIKRCAFLHDIGKALTHEVEGSHAIIGADLLRKYGESEAVAHAVEAHHNEVQPRTIEAVLTQASDTCSAARPGARRESLETYVKRLARIEEIAGGKAGVEKVFAMQSGREVRVMVQPADVDDLAAQVIAREIAKQIEDELTYPGQIRVTVVRETRTTEVAH